MNAVLIGPLTLLSSLTLTQLPDDLQNLQKKFANRVNVAMSGAEGDSARSRALRKIADEFRNKAWKLVRKYRRKKNADAVWRFALHLDDTAGAKDLLKHAHFYLKKRPEGELRAYAGMLIATVELRAISGTEDVDAVLVQYDESYPNSVLERGQLRAAAAQAAVNRGEIERAQLLYDAAIALPMSPEELAQKKRNHGRSWHSWWRARREQLDAFKVDWSDLGGVDLDGESWTVSDYHGKVLIVDYWASW